MNIEYENVPNIISGKDLDYLSDMFSWSYNAYKFTLNALNNKKEEDVTNMLKKASDEFYNILKRILSILNNGGSNE